MESSELERLVTVVANAVIAHAEELTVLDQAIGDGDHGINMKRGMEAVLSELPKLSGKVLGDVLKALGMQLVMKVGGASGPLYGTLFMELGKHLPSDPTRADAATAFGAAITAVKARGKAEVGQKTLLDVLVPAWEALASGADAAAVKATALEAAEATKPVKATRGRASFLGERSIGHMDPGARSSALMIGTLCDALVV
jgi:dihydroxyacetone kinase-like protein